MLEISGCQGAILTGIDEAELGPVDKTGLIRSGLASVWISPVSITSTC